MTRILAVLSLLLLLAFLATRRREEVRQLNWPDHIPEGIWVVPEPTVSLSNARAAALEMARCRFNGRRPGECDEFDRHLRNPSAEDGWGLFT